MSRNKKLQRFEVGDVVEEVIKRQFTIKIVGRYYGRRLYCADDRDCGTTAENLRLVSRPKKKKQKPMKVILPGQPGNNTRANIVVESHEQK